MHGVSSAGAAEVLDRPLVRQVAGDRSAGFYRPRPGLSDERGTGGVTLEAYRWSDLPSGTALRTLSLLFLFPFMLINVAVWMRPGDALGGAVVRALCRVLGLSLTSLYVLAGAGVALDLVAWQCLSSPACLSDREWLSWLGGRPVGLRLVVLALVPSAAVSLLWWGARRPGRSFTAFRAPERASAGPPLSTIGQWDTEPLMGRLRSIHIAAAFATLDGSLLAARAAQGVPPAVAALLAVTGAVLLACVVLVCLPPLVDRAPGDPRRDRIARALRATAIVLTVAVAGHLLFAPARWRADGGLPGYGSILTWLLVTHAVLLGALGVVLLWHRLRARGHQPPNGLGALVVAAAAGGLAVAYSAELVQRAADLLDRGRSPADALPGPARAYDWAIYGFFRALLVTLVAAAVVALVSRRGRTRAAQAVVERDFPAPPAEAAPRLRQVRAAIVRARFTDLLVPLAVLFAIMAGAGAATTAMALLRPDPGEALQRRTHVPAELVMFGIEVGGVALSAAVLAVVVAAVFAYRSPGFRRHVGVLFDLATFWPRSAHPFAPPCYAERAVPELARRITFLVQSGNGVLLAGYSHGSVLVAATVLQLPAEISARVALLTYSSPLRRLYARLFPAYVGDEMLCGIGGRVGWRWLNLWRDTDAVGGWIFSPHRADEPAGITGPAATVDRRLRDPDGLVAPPGDSVPPPIKGHWPAESDQAYGAAVRDLAARLRAAAP
ncbi:putative integral membrane protein [Micromonospora sp. B006]|nr:putative integral membrane protein [Micromonospora sp. B006]